MGQTTPLLRVEGLIAGYGRPVVGPVSFTVGPGEVVGLAGANGIGKSTVLNAIARGARIFAGRVERAPGLSLAYQEQRPVRLPAMPLTGRELLRAAGAEHAAPPPALAANLDRRIDTLSGGQYQLLCVWAALGSDRDLVLLDEPTNNLDPPTEALLGTLLAELRGHRAVLLVSHERRFLDDACSRVVEVEAWQGGA
jgi:ATPase subunit of ABC transporter with duplicated ATPase domains